MIAKRTTGFHFTLLCGVVVIIAPCFSSTSGFSSLFKLQTKKNQSFGPLEIKERLDQDHLAWLVEIWAEFHANSLFLLGPVDGYFIKHQTF